MGLRDFLHDRQPKSGATSTLCPCPIDPIKPLEEMRQMLRLDAMACILDRHSNVVPDHL